MNFKTLSIGIAVTCGTLTVGSTLSPAQAAWINIVGSAQFEKANSNAPASDKITFTSSTVESFKGSLFSALAVDSTVEVAPINLAAIAATPSPNDYTGTSSNPFIKFTNDPDLKFLINNPFNVTRARTTIDNFTSTSALFNFTGAFYKNGTYLSEGILTANTVNKLPGSYSLTIKTVPEPLTILGSITALGMGAALRKKQAQKHANEKVTA
ncbi:PEP-CTERM sorting domain-containing protein [Tolypothrix sp. FACHB-123]|uniref:PEP-CTERM sorting domain-containing protein n=1 Tax=Tolypothrix sp. FACHB-123 TaxID=2692868 RepID=UPI001684A8F0|nr:PEP-CTERM sorting domain-containing protein [Tolypothrix sp. FACHB-123]MBD2356820.1 PEP-CTERM sorting domain-containing protein [Tolypothrix sp. FACHB-123]